MWAQQWGNQEAQLEEICSWGIPVASSSNRMDEDDAEYGWSMLKIGREFALCKNKIF
jgi:hypothetical protein